MPPEHGLDAQAVCGACGRDLQAWQEPGGRRHAEPGPGCQLDPMGSAARNQLLPPRLALGSRSPGLALGAMRGATGCHPSGALKSKQVAGLA